jgi:transcriptional regulator with GAF, ATPase, and Fis domain
MGMDAGESRHTTEARAALASFLDLDELLRRVASYAAESVGTEASSILLHDAEAHEFVVAAATGPMGDLIRGRRFPDTAGIAGAVLRSGQPCIAPIIPGDLGRALSEIDHAADAVVRSLMAAPLKIENRIAGVVEAVNRIGGGEFETADLERFANCCSLIAVAVENASLYRRVHTDTEIFRRSREDCARPLVAESSAMRRAIAQAERAAAGRSTVLLVGETGTGKEQVARRIHDVSPRANKPFVALNCGALPESLLESELFGHEKGAFTGADRRHVGRFELADGGTLFLDEIGDLPAGAQVKLLRVLQEHEITRVGGTHSMRVNVRVIAATHRDLPFEVRAGRFREDLFFRIHVVPIRLPPLRERPEDILPLIILFLDRFARELGRSARAITREGMERLRAHRWPGNVRELENLIERLMVLGDDHPIDAKELVGLMPDDVLPALRTGEQPESGTPVIGDLSLWEQEHSLLMQALERAGQNQTRAAQVLKISREQLRTRMKRYGLLPPKS